MEQVVIDNYTTKPYKEIAVILKAQWPEWEFNVSSIKAVIKRLKLTAAPRRVPQSLIIGDKVEFFKFTSEMERIVLRNYKTKSNREICQRLKERWPQWDFKPVSIREVMRRRNIKRTKEQTHKIILRDVASDVGKKRYEKVSKTNSKHEIGQPFFSQQKLWYGKLVVRVDRKKVMYYENYIYEKHIGKIPKSQDVILIDPYGPIVPSNLTLKQHPNLSFLKKITAELDDRFVITTLFRDKHTPEERELFRNSPGIDTLLIAKRAYIQLLRAIKEYENARTAPNTTDNQVEGTPEAHD